MPGIFHDHERAEVRVQNRRRNFIGLFCFSPLFLWGKNRDFRHYFTVSAAVLNFFLSRKGSSGGEVGGAEEGGKDRDGENIDKAETETYYFPFLSRREENILHVLSLPSFSSSFSYH